MKEWENWWIHDNENSEFGTYHFLRVWIACLVATKKKSYVSNSEQFSWKSTKEVTGTRMKVGCKIMITAKQKTKNETPKYNGECIYREKLNCKECRQQLS